MIGIKVICECGNEINESELPISRRQGVILIATGTVYVCKKCGKLMKMKSFNTTDEIIGEI